MRRSGPVLALLLAAGAAAADGLPEPGAPLDVPSRQKMAFLEVIWPAADETDTRIVRFRFVAPGIAPGAGQIGFDVTEIDMAALCEAVALPAVLARAQPVDQIIISVSDRPVAFGVSDSSVTQFFDAFHQEGTTCVLDVL